ncbi:MULTISPECIES: GNAT family N-acetyltransferase [unclassified Sulfitobacter]|jgi:GNAT superfamily N-acetyltransferase|uniref:GNAT family N-acetyltransferase n=1 Tax=unclassified Sulfitobacter TaxID=196795 RepID=UPI0015930218|nr:GNAT family N-acetyltransferase [Sulfitobacter sp. HGT1]MBQ0805216.1 GNAT family N-acetyltransferase [Sulfitobacter sp.]
MTVTTRPLAASDRAAWETLFAGYAAFYKVDQTPDMRETVFGWLMDETHSSNCIVAQDASGKLIGLTHYRPFVSQLRAITNCFLDDLFVDPAARGSGAAQALIGAVKSVAEEKGWGTVRWITAEDNYRGRAVYDKLATRTPWVTYDIKL